MGSVDWISAAWIVWEVAYAVYTQVWLRTLTPPEWIMAGSGVLFAFAILFAEFRGRIAHLEELAAERDAHSKQMEGLKESLARAQGKIEAKLDVVTLLGGETVRRFQNVTHTTDQSIGESILVATTKIETLENQVASLQKAQGRRITSIQRTKFLDGLRNMNVDDRFIIVYVVEGDPEADDYGMQLFKLLGDAGFNCGFEGLRRDIDFAPLDKFGLAVLVKRPDALALNAQWLIQGLRYADIEYELTSERIAPNAREDFLGVRIGPKPVLNGNSN